MTLSRITTDLLDSARSETRGVVRYKLLGAFEVSGIRDCTPAAPKLRSVLALLLLQANRVVNLDTLIDELWGPDPPKSAVTIVQTYIYHLRKIFVAEHLDPVAQRLIATRQPGYLFHTQPEQVDADVFDFAALTGSFTARDGREPFASAVANAMASAATFDVPREGGGSGGGPSSPVFRPRRPDPVEVAARLRGPRTGRRGVNIHPTPGIGFPPMSRPSSNSQGCSAWNSWNESLDRTCAPTRSATRRTNASPRPMAPAGGETNSPWATASSKMGRSSASMR